ncbi:hypothetical protein F183_A38010 [Bryobacterales bacterium F-183]|nr:hypothetical protein F183_A38010 [Bryobacterales bacterium F-183]
MSNSELDGFLRAAKAQGASDEFLVRLMQQHGWPERSVYEALGRHYAESTGLPMPAARGALESAREAFFHLLAFGTLSVWMYAIGSIWFTMIEYWFPDATSPYYGSRSWRIREVSWQIAAILVSFPVFAYATRKIVADLIANPDNAASAVRRWLTNIALLITALVFIGDLVAFLATFLQGEITARFAAKSLVVLVLSGAVFAYYTRGVNTRGAAVLNAGWHRQFAMVAGVLIVLTLVIGFWRTGSPGNQRVLAEDRRRVQDLHALADTIHMQWEASSRSVEERKLPGSLGELQSQGRALYLRDPFTQQPYEYRVVDGAASRYELCATFGQASEAPAMGAQPSAWWHGGGRHCYAWDAGRVVPWPGGE